MHSSIFTQNCRKFFLYNSIPILLFAACASSSYATAEQDFDPGPPKNASNVSLPAPLDVVTSSNTHTYPAPTRQPRLGPTFPANRQPAGALSGRIIYTSGGHGYHALTNGVWDTDRPTYPENSAVPGISEDLGNQDQMTLFVYQAFNAGATIVPFRPVGSQTNEVIIDNDDPQVTLTGNWSDSTGTPYYGQTNDSVNYLFTPAASVETATARYTPNIPVRGYYPVYGWALNSTNRCIDQLYRIAHASGISEVHVNHRKVGKGWVYLGTYYFEAGTSGYAEISNQSSSPSNSNAIADAIRFGNGMGDIVRYGEKSGKPREEEASRYWVQAMMGQGTGRDESVYDRSTLGDGKDNVGTPPRMAAYMNDDSQGVMTDRVFISFHSNGGSGNARGALGLWNNESTPGVAADTYTPNQLALARDVGGEVNRDMRAIGSPPLENAWSTRTTNDYSREYAFGEIRWDTINHEMDATINEVAFHDNVLDAALLGDSRARTDIARATLQGLVRYFNTFGAGPLAFSPVPPVNVKAIANANGTVTVSWTKPPTSPEGSQAPTGYVVYSSTNGYGFGNPHTISGGSTTQLTVSGITPNQPVYFQVSSTNPGGESLPSEVLAVRLSGNSTNSTLIVNGFDRIDRFLSPTETNVGLTAFKRVKPWRANNGDYIVQHAQALDAAGRNFDSASNEAVNLSMLNSYNNAIWVLGQESTVDHTFSVAEQTMVTSYLNNGNNLFVSGAEVAWDLDHSGNGATFYHNTIGANYISDDANTYNVSSSSGIFSSLGAFEFGPESPKNNSAYPPPGYAPYDAAYPDVISPFNNNGAALLTYSTGGTAAVRYVKSGSKVIALGFPFECIVSDSDRANMMTAIMNDFAPIPSSVRDWSVY